MDEPTLLEQIWENRTLLWLFSAFVVAVLFTFRPGSRKVHRDTSEIPFRHEDKPAAEPHSDGDSEEARQ